MKHSRLGDMGYYVSPNPDVALSDVLNECSNLGFEPLAAYPPGVFQHFIDLYPGTKKSELVNMHSG